MTLLYTLDDRKPVPCSDVLAWARWFETADRRVAYDQLKSYEVSTIFLGVNYCYWPNGDPIVFETMAFSAAGSIEETRRYSTWEEAEIGHKMVVSLLKTVEEAP